MNVWIRAVLTGLFILPAYPFARGIDELFWSDDRDSEVQKIRIALAALVYVVFLGAGLDVLSHEAYEAGGAQTPRGPCTRNE